MKACLLIFLLLLGCASHTPKPNAGLCTREGASQKGAADAQSGKEMLAIEVADGCDSSLKAAVEKWYREGYAANDGVEAVKPDEKTAATDHQKSECRRKSDCEGAKWCRNRGDGVWLCLGNEPRSGYCQYEDDCAGGRLCTKDQKKIGHCE